MITSWDASGSLDDSGSIDASGSLDGSGSWHTESPTHMFEEGSWEPDGSVNGYVNCEVLLSLPPAWLTALAEGIRPRLSSRSLCRERSPSPAFGFGNTFERPVSQRGRGRKTQCEHVLEGLLSDDLTAQFRAARSCRIIMGELDRSLYKTIIESGVVPHLMRFSKDTSRPDLQFEAEWVLILIELQVMTSGDMSAMKYISRETERDSSDVEDNLSILLGGEVPLDVLVPQISDLFSDFSFGMDNTRLAQARSRSSSQTLSRSSSRALSRSSSRTLSRSNSCEMVMGEAKVARTAQAPSCSSSRTLSRRSSRALSCSRSRTLSPSNSGEMVMGEAEVAQIAVARSHNSSRTLCRNSSRTPSRTPSQTLSRSNSCEKVTGGAVVARISSPSRIRCTKIFCNEAGQSHEASDVAPSDDLAFDGRRDVLTGQMRELQDEVDELTSDLIKLKRQLADVMRG